MTLLRKTALSIVNMVSRLGTPSFRTWARAMTGEIHSIESDWEAFRWALGSMHVLFVYKRQQMMTLADVPTAAKTLASKMNQRTWIGGAVVTAMAVFFARNLLLVSNVLQRVGCALLVIALLYMLFQVVGARPRKITVEADLLARAAHYGSELRREWNFHRGNSLWSRLIVAIPGFLLLCIGGMIAHPTSTSRDAVQMLLFLLFAGLAIPNNQRFAKRYATQIHELDQLQLKR